MYIILHKNVYKILFIMTFTSINTRRLSKKSKLCCVCVCVCVGAHVDRCINKFVILYNMVTRRQYNTKHSVLLYALDLVILLLL